MQIAAPSPLSPGSLLALTSQEDVAALFGVPVQRLRFHLYSERAPHYREFHIPKARGASRIILSPPRVLKSWQSRLAELLTATFTPKSEVHGFVRSRGIATNAAAHVARRFVLTIDLQDFFPSIHFGRVRGVFLKPPFSLPNSVAATLAQLCTLNGRLPQGAPTSPIISNLVCRRLDSDLTKLASKHGFRYTRYADDMTFSSNASDIAPELVASHDPYGSAVTLGDELLHLIAKHQFVVQTAKTRVRNRHQRQEVTGVVVNKTLNVPRTYVRRLRAILHNCKKLGYAETEKRFVALDQQRMCRYGSPPTVTTHIKGKLEYLRMIRGAGDLLYVNYALKARRLLIGLPPVRIIGPASRHPDFIEEAIWVVIGKDINGAQVAQGTAFFLEHVGIVTAKHVVENPTVPVAEWSLMSMRPNYPSAHINGYRANPNLDLAVLQCDAETNGFFRAARTHVVSGQAVLILGYPNWHTLADHTLVAHSQVVQMKAIGGFTYSSVVYPLLSGASGAPVLDDQGVVVGVVANSPGNTILPNAFVSIQHVDTARSGASTPV
jgi:RNA-directed DNA polymerase